MTTSKNAVASICSAAWLCLCAFPSAQENSSAPEGNAFAGWFCLPDVRREPASESGLFLGRRLSGRGQDWSVLQWDREKNAISEVLTTGTVVSLLRERSPAFASMNSSGTLGVVAVPVLQKPPRRNAYDLCVLDFVADTVRTLVADGRFNFWPLLSPDGRFVAYWSTDPAVGYEKDVPRVHNVGRVVDLESGVVTDVMPGVELQINAWEPVVKAAWLDAERVLFQSFTDDEMLLRRIGPGYEGKTAPYVLSYDACQQRKDSLVFPGGRRGLQFLVDPERPRILFSNDRMVLETSVDLTHRKMLVEAEEGRAIFQVRLESGVLRYELGDAPESGADASVADKEDGQ